MMTINPLATNVPTTTAKKGFVVVWSTEIHVRGTSLEDAVAEAILIKRGVPTDATVYRTTGGDYWYPVPDPESNRKEELPNEQPSTLP